MMRHGSPRLRAAGSRSTYVHTEHNASVVPPSAKASDSFGICGTKFRGREWPICCYALILLVIILFLVLSGCSTSRISEREAAAVARLTGGGDAKAGRSAIRTYGCANCHTIGGVEGAH